MDKLRIKTEKELAEQGRTLAAVRDILVARSITPLVADGTLLGIVREGDFIPWDWDAGVYVVYEEVKGLGEKLVSDLEEAGFEIVVADFGRKVWKIAAEKNGFLVEVRGWYRQGAYFRRKHYRVPARYVLEQREVVLRGERYLAPRDCEGYLSFVYGPDWRTPKRSTDHRVYLSNAFCGRRSIHRLWCSGARLLRAITRALLG